MRNHFVSILILIAISLLISCSEDEPKVVKFSVDINADSFNSSGGSKSINLYSNVSWNVSTGNDWLSVSPTNGSGDATLTITAIENNTDATRNGVVTITSEHGEELKINISQITSYQFQVDKKEILIDSEVSDFTIELVSTVPWNAKSDADWLSIEPNAGTEDANIVVSASVNEDENERSATIVITPEVGDPIEVTVTQKGTPIVEEKIVKYVAHAARGSASGDSEENAADFLNDVFWGHVNNDLKSKKVEVVFLPGTYSRAFTSKALILKNMGNPKNQLRLVGGDGVIFTAPTGHADKNQMIRIEGCQNLVVSGFNFTGDGRIGYVLRVITTATSTMPNKDIVIENCTWRDMGGIIYGATGCYGTETSNVTYIKCDFRRIGIDSHSHHMYHAHGPSLIKILDSHFEDCTGDYVRFRDRCDYNLVRNCTFVRNQAYTNRPFIAVPLFNNVDPGDEFFVTNYAFTNNTFTNKSTQRTTNGIYFGHWGFTPPGFKYLLTEAEGNTINNGTVKEKTELLKNNFGLDMSKIRVASNTYVGITNNVALISQALYGAESLGWVGTANITNLTNTSNIPFDWE